MELADLVGALPPGCALWRATGGELAWTQEVHMLANVEFGVRVLAWQKSEDGSKGKNKPEPAAPPKSVHEVKQEEARLSARAAAYLRRTGG